MVETVVLFQAKYESAVWDQRENPERIFELFVEIGKPSGDKEEPFILQHYPPNYTDEGILKDVPKFAYPCSTECAAVDYFTFVLTDTKSKFTYGFCRHATSAQTCLCILSSLPWYEIFYRFLNLLAEISNRTEKNDVTLLLNEAYKLDLPEPCSQVTIVAQEEMFTFTAPDPNKLPSIPASRNLTEYYNAMDTRNMVKIFASLLHERRILFISKKLSRVTACIHAAAALIYPMNWQHLFIPILPNSYTDLLSAPMPFMIGVHSTMMEKTKKMDLSGVVIVDTDNNTVTQDLQDDDSLPDEMTSILKKMLKNDKVKSSMQLEGDAISQAFLMSLVRTIGGYRDALKFQPSEKITFQKDAFLLSRPSSMRPFLEDLLELQIFHEFINERLDMLNCGIGFTDVFEREATLHADKLNAHSRYKEWLSNMKKQGKKLQRGGKDIWDDFKVKVKSQSKKTYTGLKSKIEDFYKEDLIPGSNKLTNLKIRSGGIKPSTILASELKSLRPPRPPPRIKSSITRGSPKIYSRASDRNSECPDSPKDRSKHYRLINVEDKTSDDFDLLRSQRVGINLLDDPDIQSAIRKSVSLEEITHPREESDLSSLDSGSGTPSEGAQFSYVDLTTIDESVELASAGNKSLPTTITRQWSSPSNTTLFSMEESAPVGNIDQWQSFDSPEKKPPDINHSASHLYPQPSSSVTATKDNIQEKEHDVSNTTVNSCAPKAPAVPPRPSAKTVANTVASFQDDFAPMLPPRGKRADSDFMKFEESTSFDPFEDNSQNPSLAGPETASTTITLEGPPEKTNFRRKVGGTSISRTPAFRRAKQNSLNITSEPPEVVDNRDDRVKSSDPTSMFDPLTNPDAVEVNSSQAESSKAAPSDDEELLRDWDFHKKTSYNCISTVPPTLTSQSSVSAVPASPFFRTPLHPSSSPQLRCKSANIRDYSQISRQRTIEVDTTQRPGSSDLFADLVDLHRGKSRTPSPQPKSWQAFQ
ncbi:DENN domain-containing protein 1A isoform X3 [Octopus sinensis]|uniref:DENN domain-containing protein 1A isoform X3 n=1 Tax=Octopus sinensis TaxID=2607531 RepID=A0A6P7TI11_9MOLL|nr:DENN domain-containing protein 1A isoform X3 [Octopus sinensis]